MGVERLNHWEYVFFPFKFSGSWLFSPNVSSMVQYGSMGVMASFMGDPKGLWPCFVTSPAILEVKKSASQNPKVHPVTAAEVKPKTCCPVFPPTPCCDLAGLVVWWRGYEVQIIPKSVLFETVR